MQRFLVLIPIVGTSSSTVNYIASMPHTAAAAVIEVTYMCHTCQTETGLSEDHIQQTIGSTVVLDLGFL